METLNPEYETEVRRVFSGAPFIQSLGAELVEFAPGYCRSRIQIDPHHQQQDGFIHAGVQATLADHTAGTAAATLIPAGKRVLTAEFKINLLRAAQGRLLCCEATVLKPGRTLIVAEAEVYAQQAQRQLVAKATVTLAVVDVERGGK
ncbi:PaaI family thioesterase [Marinobacterium arenosum]|uniref:PaaI family thioesterase n=1 Tax=Marinobacterium arenosum TaxID=2862496 RepID=UPI001C9751AD|nr:PaaI family thioesterase [Marinobacterium arenosum]MBY4676326.1 PaaI family thioesterase [Marinobacterium arenosum]